MTKQEFIEKYHWQVDEDNWHFLVKDLDRLIDSVIAEAIAEHEAKQWHKYTEEKPEDGVYMVYRGNREWVSIDKYEDGEFSFMDEDITAWRELPAPYQEGGHND